LARKRGGSFVIGSGFTALPGTPPPRTRRPVGYTGTKKAGRPIRSGRRGNGSQTMSSFAALRRTDWGRSRRRGGGGEGLDDGVVEGREIVGLPAGGEVAVADHLLVHPLGPGVLEVLLDGVVRGHPAALHDARVDH